MPVGYELFDKVNVRSGDKWYPGVVIDSILTDGVSFLIVDYIDTDMQELAQSIVNINYLGKCVSSLLTM